MSYSNTVDYSQLASISNEKDAMKFIASLPPWAQANATAYWNSTGKQRANLSNQILGMERSREAKVQGQEKAVMSLYDQIISMYGKDYGSGELASLQRQKTRDLASAQQSLVSAGLYGSTMTAGLGKKWEEEIGVPTRMKLEDARKAALSGAYAQKAQAIANIDYADIDYSGLAALASAGYGR